MVNPDPPGTGVRSSRAIPQTRRLSIIAWARLLMLLMLLAACDQAPFATSSPPATPSLGAQTAPTGRQAAANAPNAPMISPARPMPAGIATTGQPATTNLALAVQVHLSTGTAPAP